METLLSDLGSRLFCIFFGGLECVGHSFAYVAHFVFLRDVWIRTQRAAVASRRATNLATYLPEPPILPPACRVRMKRGIRLRDKLPEAGHRSCPIVRRVRRVQKGGLEIASFKIREKHLKGSSCCTVHCTILYSSCGLKGGCALCKCAVCCISVDLYINFYRC